MTKNSSIDEPDWTSHYFVFSSYGDDFVDRDKMLATWQAHGLTVCLYPNRQCDTEFSAIFRHGFAAGGILQIYDEVPKTFRVHEFDYRIKSRKFPYGTSIGNNDGMRLRQHIHIVEPDFAPAIVSKITGAQAFRSPSTHITFEHIPCNMDQQFLLVVLKSNQELDPIFFQWCAYFNINTSVSATIVKDIIPDITDWFGQSSHKIYLFDIEKTNKSLLFQFSELCYIAEHYDSNRLRPRLESVHLLANFNPFQPNFRKYWTSNK